MTPFTSFLALENEQAYAAQGITRKQQPGQARLVASRVELKDTDKLYAMKGPVEEEASEKAHALPSGRMAAKPMGLLPEPPATVQGLAWWLCHHHPPCRGPRMSSSMPVRQGAASN